MLADGMESCRQVAAQRVKDRAKEGQIQYSYMLPQDAGRQITQALPSDERSEFEAEFGDAQLALPAVMIAAD